MNRRFALAGLAVFVVLLAGCAGRSTPERIAPLLDGMGALHRPISTRDKLAQQYFDQALTLGYGFNHAEAERSFRQVTLLDPKCAMGYWGIALVLGPNINAQMDTADVARAWAAMEKARELSSRGSAVEQALISALSVRYAPSAVEGRSGLDSTYAEAMRAVAGQFPGDDDVLTLCAEALMDLHPWDFYDRDGVARPWTREIVDLFETVIARNPEHPGANHYYIHATEAAADPAIGEGAADRLRGLVPAAGHLVHMPSHIYINTGRYREASEANIAAMAADEKYVSQCHAQGIYPLAYVPHNAHFLWATSTLEGRSALALDAAKRTADFVDPAMMCAPGFGGSFQHFRMTPLYAKVRFGKWDEILAEPKPQTDSPYPPGVWHYARGEAFVRTGRVSEAKGELEGLQAALADPGLEGVTVWDINTARGILEIADKVLSGEIAAAEKKYKVAIADLEEAAAMEDALRYDEPPTWFLPVRLVMGAVLLEAGRAAEAERVYREDLKVFPRNGWALFGLAESLRLQGRKDEAATVEKDFADAWQHADIQLTSSRI